MKINKLWRSLEIRNASWIIGGQILQKFLLLVVGVLTARFLGPGNYGLINYGNAYVAFFTALCNLGLNSVIIKDFVDHPDEQGEAIGSSLIMRLISSGLSVVCIVSVVSIVDKDESLTIIVVFLCSIGSIFHIFETFNFWFQNQYKSKMTSIASLCAYVITAVYKIVLLILGKDVRWFAFATSVDYIAVAIFLCGIYKQHKGPRLKFSLHKSKSLLNVSYNYILSSIMVALYGQTDKLMLKQMLDENAVGYYATATAICSMCTFVLQAIIDSLYPSILRLKNESQTAYERKNRQLYAIVFYASCFMSIGFLILGKPIVCILYGEAYLPSVPILKVVTWYTAFSYLGVARNAWIVSEGRQKYLKYMYGCAAIMNVLLNSLLIPHMGAMGAAIASLITQISTSIVLPMFFREMRPNAKLMIDAICLRNVL